MDFLRSHGRADVHFIRYVLSLFAPNFQFERVDVDGPQFCISRDICVSLIAFISIFLFIVYSRLAQLVCVAAEQHRHSLDYSESADHPHEHIDSAFELLWSVVGSIQAQLSPCGVLDAGMSCW